MVILRVYGRHPFAGLRASRLQFLRKKHLRSACNDCWLKASVKHIADLTNSINQNYDSPSTLRFFPALCGSWWVWYSQLRSLLGLRALLCSLPSFCHHFHCRRRFCDRLGRERSSFWKWSWCDKVRDPDLGGLSQFLWPIFIFCSPSVSTRQNHVTILLFHEQILCAPSVVPNHHSDLLTRSKNLIIRANVKNSCVKQHFCLEPETLPNMVFRILPKLVLCIVGQTDSLAKCRRQNLGLCDSMRTAGSSLLADPSFRR